MPQYAVINADGTINWSRDPDLVNVTHSGAGRYTLSFSTDCHEDVFVLHAKTQGPGCDAPSVVAASIQGDSRTICVGITNTFDPAGGEDSQFSYIRYRKADEF